MKERPILFSGGMVRAILAGTKTQTRRVVKPQPRHASGVDPWTTLKYFGDGVAIECGPDYPDDKSDHRRCPYGVPGDRLWVRETFARVLGSCFIFRATDAMAPGYGYKWRPSIHMPRQASRLTLEVGGVRVQRLQQIDHDDVCAEGIDDTRGGFRACVDRYAALWNSINGPGAWDLNPWVWAVTFKRV